MIKKVLIVNDIATIGKVASTVALPIFATALIEPHILPTVLLSSHTAFKNVFKQNLTQEMVSILQQINRLPIPFDAIVTGYFANTQQIDLFLDHLPSTSLLIVDPIMGDNGKMYHGFTLDYVSKMKSLCQKANIIIPNITEACLLLNNEMKPIYTIEEINVIVDNLLAFGCQSVIITGVQFNSNSLSVVSKTKGEALSIVTTEKIDTTFFGTGDLFTALLSSTLIHHIPLKQSITFATQFILHSLKDTLDNQKDVMFGVLFENQLPQLYQFISKGKLHDK